ncbi:MAG: UDP-N-acetylglucosamine pyrophosphorylase, partial [Lachnospiraceae bacterium]|nr:UDP-N-acetylglucosamine pyrophosphorylase [Lachnospiraceae bacterium]
MDAVKVEKLYNLEETIAADLFMGVVYPWEVLGRIHDFIIELGNSLPEELFEKRGENIWVAKSAHIATTASLNGPLIVDEEAEIRHCAY